MAVLTTAHRATVQKLVDYLALNHDLPIDASVVEQLDKVFGGDTGFPCACGIKGNSLRDSLRDEPVRTFLRLLLLVSDTGTGPDTL
jgi:hypothetical protein